MNTFNETKSILNKYNIRANKRFGQNFLIDDNILTNIIGVSNITKKDLVIEIGPGLGNLTRYILEKSGYALLVEIDTNMINILNDRLGNYNNYSLINQDILKININGNKEYEYSLAYLGDVNGNGGIDIIDYIRVMKHIMGTSTLSGVYYESADINKNNNIDIIDYIRIMKIIMEEN